jgi:hypothetical protein
MVGVLNSPASGTFGLPWPQWRRGLFIAVVLSVLAHGLTFNALDQSFDFKFNERSGTASLNTRVIQAASEKEAGAQPQAPAQPAPKPAKAVATQAAPQPAPAAPSAAPPANPMPRAQAPSVPSETENLEQNKPVAGENTAQNATETIASITPTAQTTSDEGAAAAQPSIAVQLQYPPNAVLDYAVQSVRRGQSTSGSGQVSWKIDGSEYELQLESAVLGFVVLTQKSVGTLNSQGLAPERFSDKRLNRSEQAAHFMRAQGIVKFSNNQPDAPLLPGMQDRLSVLLQLAGIIGGDTKRYEIVNRILIPVAGADKSELWEFSLEKPLDITVPAANMRAIKLVRKPRNEFDQKLEIWLSPQLGYLPIRILQADEQNPEGSFTELSLKRLP